MTDQPPNLSNECFWIKCPQCGKEVEEIGGTIAFHHCSVQRRCPACKEEYQAGKVHHCKPKEETIYDMVKRVTKMLEEILESCKCPRCHKLIDNQSMTHMCKGPDPRPKDLIFRGEVMKMLDAVDCNVVDDKTDIIHETVTMIRTRIEAIKGQDWIDTA